MFVKAIEEVGQFTRPIHMISRNYNEKVVNLALIYYLIFSRKTN